MIDETAALDLRAVSAGYSGSRVLEDVSVSCAGSEMTLLVGPNGAGKTTLLRAILGLMPYTGNIQMRGRNIDGPPSRRVAEGLALVPEGRLLFPRLTVRENLLLGATAIGIRRKTAAKRLPNAVEPFPMLQSRMELQAGALSGGQQQMVAISRALMSEPKVLCLDEPSLGLAPGVWHQVIQALREVAEAGAAVLLVEQRFAEVLGVVDSTVVLSRGRVVASFGRSDEVRPAEIYERYVEHTEG